MDKKFLEKKGLLEEAKRFQYIMEYVGGANTIEEVDGNGDGLDDATGMVDPGLADPTMGGAAPMGAAPADPTMGGAAPMGAAPADPAAGGAGVPGFNPQGPEAAPSVPATTAESFDEATPENDQEAAEGGEEEEIDVDELVDSQKRNEKAIEKLTDKFEKFIEKFNEFQGEIKSNADFMTKLENEFEKRNPTSVEKLSMRSTKSTPFAETPAEYMENEAPENYSPEDDNNGVDDPRYVITRDDVRNATDYSDIAKTLRNNGNATLKNLLGF